MSKNNSKTPEKSVRKALKSADCLTLAEQKEIEKLSTKKYKLRRKQQENDRMKDGIEEAAENGWF